MVMTAGVARQEKSDVDLSGKDLPDYDVYSSGTELPVVDKAASTVDNSTVNLSHSGHGFIATTQASSLNSDKIDHIFFHYRNKDQHDGTNF